MCGLGLVSHVRASLAHGCVWLCHRCDGLRYLSLVRSEILEKPGQWAWQVVRIETVAHSRKAVKEGRKKKRKGATQ